MVFILLPGVENDQKTTGCGLNYGWSLLWRFALRRGGYFCRFVTSKVREKVVRPTALFGAHVVHTLVCNTTMLSASEEYQPLIQLLDARGSRHVWVSGLHGPTIPFSHVELNAICSDGSTAKPILGIDAGLCYLTTSVYWGLLFRYLTKLAWSEAEKICFR